MQTPSPCQLATASTYALQNRCAAARRGCTVPASPVTAEQSGIRLCTSQDTKVNGTLTAQCPGTFAWQQQSDPGHLESPGQLDFELRLEQGWRQNWMQLSTMELWRRGCVMWSSHQAQRSSKHACRLLWPSSKDHGEACPCTCIA